MNGQVLIKLAPSHCPGSRIGYRYTPRKRVHTEGRVSSRRSTSANLAGLRISSVCSGLSIIYMSWSCLTELNLQYLLPPPLERIWHMNLPFARQYVNEEFCRQFCAISQAFAFTSVLMSRELLSLLYISAWI